MKKIISGTCYFLIYLAACHREQSQPLYIPPRPPVQITQNALVLWDGELQSTGVGWVSPDDSSMYTGTEDSVCHSPGKAIVVHMAHPGAFLESGWQWSSWSSPKETDFTLYDTLKFSIKMSGILPPDLNLSLASPGNHHTSQRLSLKHYQAGLMDGQWHELSIPLKDFYTPGMTFDPAHAIQIIAGTWNDHENFTFYLDDLILAR